MALLLIQVNSSLGTGGYAVTAHICSISIPNIDTTASLFGATDPTANSAP